MSDQLITVRCGIFFAQSWRLPGKVITVRCGNFFCPALSRGHRRLIGAQSFTDEEMGDPILRGHEDLLNPCDRVGPLSLAYYWRAVGDLVATIRSALFH